MLLDRQSKPLRATVDGRRAYEMARRVLTSITELRSTVGSETDFVGELRLGVSPFLADQALAAPFEELHKSFPRLIDSRDEYLVRRAHVDGAIRNARCRRGRPDGRGRASARPYS